MYTHRGGVDVALLRRHFLAFAGDSEERGIQPERSESGRGGNACCKGGCASHRSVLDFEMLRI